MLDAAGKGMQTAGRGASDEMRQGKIVEHPRFGTGVIQAMMGDQIIVAFPDGETKQFLLSYMLSSKQDQRT